MKILQLSFLVASLISSLLTTDSHANIYFDDTIIDTYSIPNSSTGITWYVDGTNGDDVNNGLTIDTAFKSLTRAVNKYKALACGDTIKLATGTYYERITLSNKFICADDNRITIGPYGDGRVILDATDTDKLVWEVHDSNIYKFDYTGLGIGVQTPRPQAIIMDDNFKAFRPVQSLAEVNSYGKWFWNSADNYVYVYTDGRLPTDHNVVVVPYDVNTIRYVISTNLGVSGINIMGLTLQGSTAQAIWLQGNYWKIEQCIVRYSAKGAVYGKGATADKIGFHHQEFSKNHMYGNVLLNWPRGTTWNHSGGWPPALTMGNYSIAHGNIIHDNGGEGIIVGQREGHDTIEDNIVYDNWSVGIYCGSSPQHIVRRNLIYVSKFDLSDIMDTNLIPTWSSVAQIANKLRQAGTTIGEEYAATLTSRADGTKIYNNLIIHCRTGFNYIGERGTLGDEKMQNHIFVNNTIILPETYDEDYDKSFGFNFRYFEGRNINNIFKNNIIYGTNDKVGILKWDVPNDPGIDVNNNIYFTANDNAFVINPESKSLYDKVDFSAYQAYGHDNTTLLTDPKFELLGNKLTDPSYYKLQLESPLLDQAVTFTELFTNDFSMLFRDAQWDIGAFESNIGDTPPETMPLLLKIIYNSKDEPSTP